MDEKFETIHKIQIALRNCEEQLTQLSLTDNNLQRISNDYVEAKHSLRSAISHEATTDHHYAKYSTLM
jgi:hypothetical protein